MKILGLVLLAFATFPIQAKALSLSALAGGGFSWPGIKADDRLIGTTAGTGLTGGMLVNHYVKEWLVLESGAYFSQKTFGNSSSKIEVFQTFQQILLPMTAKFYLHPLISVGIGGYFSQGIGGVTSQQGDNVQHQSYHDAEFSSSDYGTVASFTAEFPLAEMYGLLLHCEYLFGLKDIDLTMRRFRTIDLRVLAGVKYFL